MWSGLLPGCIKENPYVGIKLVAGTVEAEDESALARFVILRRDDGD